jgi:transposase
MAKRIRQVDVLKEIRRAMRALRRAEASILAFERAEKRADEKVRERAELKRLAAGARRPTEHDAAAEEAEALRTGGIAL